MFESLDNAVWVLKEGVTDALLLLYAKFAAWRIVFVLHVEQDEIQLSAKHSEKGLQAFIAITAMSKPFRLILDDQVLESVDRVVCQPLPKFSAVLSTAAC